ncbi:GRIP and coiled-coil domain-containing protein 2-like [Ruditapes philippinarum]|uniref:GRIP and coiled-coil domain-containing protein 2-like n=1 Tax=Ruditapes philippinarum TaxID=129788 RepID=UPI00295BFB45|nr:GRIP and coiled-coil domain-containing protein 2-like [Ruditapes philippinarum]
MADAGEKGEEGHSQGGSPASKLDNLAREDLLKFVKRQMVNMQKLKGKNEDLSKKMVELEKKADGGEGTDIEKKLSEATAEKQEIMMKYQAVQLELERQRNLTEDMETEISGLKEQKANIEGQLAATEKKDKELHEQLECMKMKDETMANTFQVFQSEADQLAKANKVCA